MAKHNSLAMLALALTAVALPSMGARSRSRGLTRPIRTH